ncbi:MAG: PrpF domain-containing protein, partial [Pseudomonadota bacterium]
PKFGLVAPARDGGTLAVRYFMPWKTHPTMAVTGAQCMASCALTPGTVTDGLLDSLTASPAEVVLEHASGKIDVLVEFSTDEGFTVKAAGLVRTARKLADGHVYVPKSVWKES